MFKYSLGQAVYYLKDNKVHIALILSRKYVDNVNLVIPSTSNPKVDMQFGSSGISYATCHGEFKEHQVFISKEALKDSL